MCWLNGILKFPTYNSSGIGFSSLKSLNLRRVRIDESFGDCVSTGCKFLKTLCLLWIKGTKSIAINNSSLRVLSIFTMDHELCHLHVSAEILVGMTLWWEFDSPDNKALQLYAPKLQTFSWNGKILSFPLTEN